MRSRLWCGLFTTLGAGMGTIAYLANQGGRVCERLANKVISEFINTTVDVSSLDTNVEIDHIPIPIPLSLEDLRFSINDALPLTFKNVLEAMPDVAYNLCNTAVYLEGTKWLLLLAIGGGLMIHLCRDQFHQLREQQANKDYISINSQPINEAPEEKEEKEENEENEKYKPIEIAVQKP